MSDNRILLPLLLLQIIAYGLGTVGGNYLVGVCRDITGDFFIVFMGLCLMLGFATLFSYLLPEDRT